MDGLNGTISVGPPKPAAQSLAGKLAAIMGELSRVPKNGRNQAQGYDYATEADIAEAVRSLMSKHRVVCLPSFSAPTFRTVQTNKGTTLTVCTVIGTFTYLDADSGQTFVVTFPGEGMDSGDKAVYKAMTGAEKYCLLKTFLISSGDDPENDAGERPSRTESVKTKARELVERASSPKPGEPHDYQMPFASKSGKWERGAPISSLENEDISGLLGWKGAKDDLRAACTAELKRRGWTLPEANGASHA